MNIYNGIETLRNLFRPVIIANGPGHTAADDARILAGIGTGAGIVCSNNGITYWYYFIDDEKNLDLAQALFRRNGLAPRFHWSHYDVVTQKTFSIATKPYVFIDYNNKTHPTLRIAEQHLRRNPQFDGFLGDINYNSGKIPTIDDMALNQLRAKMFMRAK